MGLTKNQILIFAVGALCSFFVGTMYSWNKIKDEVSGMADVKDLLGDIGFIGQYCAFIPGAIFDMYGTTVTVLYGAVAVLLGFLGLSFACLKQMSWLAIVGIILVGQGSKGLGFGTMLGTLASLPEDWSGKIAGIFLAFDACSAILVLEAWKRLFHSNPIPFYSKGMASDTVPDMEMAPINYFLFLGILVGFLGFVTAGLYMKLLKKPVAEEEESILEKGAKEAEKRHSVLSRVSSASAKEAIMSSSFTKEAVESDEKAVKKSVKTWYPGVICVYLIAVLGESTGLVWNGTGSASIQAFQKLEDGKFSVDKVTNDLFDEENLLKDAYKAAVNSLHQECVSSDKKKACFEKLSEKINNLKIEKVDEKYVIGNQDFDMAALLKDKKDEDVFGVNRALGVFTESTEALKKDGKVVKNANGEEIKARKLEGAKKLSAMQDDHRNEHKKNHGITKKMLENADSEPISLTGHSFTHLASYWVEPKENGDHFVHTPVQGAEDKIKKALGSTDAETFLFSHDRSKFHVYDTNKIIMVYAFMNGVGRFSFGLFGDMTHGKVASMPKSVYLLIGMCLYFALYGYSYFFGITTGNITYLYIIYAIAYGGTFTAITSYMKQIVAPEQVGVILGGALFCMAIGNFVLKSVVKGSLELSFVAGDQVGEELNKSFFLVCCLLQVITIPIAVFLWRHQVKQLDEQKKIELDESSDESDEN